MPIPQRASGANRTGRQVQRSIDQGRELSLANQRETAALRSELAQATARLEAMAARLAALEESQAEQDLLIDGGAP